MIIIEILFWILLGLLYLGVGIFPFQEVVIGVCALVIGIEKLVTWLRSR